MGVGLLCTERVAPPPGHTCALRIRNSGDPIKNSGDEPWVEPWLPTVRTAYPRYVAPWLTTVAPTKVAPPPGHTYALREGVSDCVGVWADVRIADPCARVCDEVCLPAYLYAVVRIVDPCARVCGGLGTGGAAARPEFGPGAAAERLRHE